MPSGCCHLAWVHTGERGPDGACAAEPQHTAMAELGQATSDTRNHGDQNQTETKGYAKAAFRSTRQCS